MDEKNLIIAPGLSLNKKNLWTEKDFKFAIKKFTRHAPTAPVPRLYDAYRWLKERLDNEDEESKKQFTLFIEHLLRILEERGAGESEIYSEILRDSAEYKYFKGLFHTDDPDNETPLLKNTVKRSPSERSIKKQTLRNVLLKKNSSLPDIDIDSWRNMVNDYFKEFKTEESFEKNCISLVKKIIRKEKKEPYHIEIIIVYAFDKLLKNKNLPVEKKNFAMQLLNFTAERGEMWNRLHPIYMEIIRN